MIICSVITHQGREQIYATENEDLSWIDPTGPRGGWVCVCVAGDNTVFTVKTYKLVSVLNRKENFTLKHGDLV